MSHSAGSLRRRKSQNQNRGKNSEQLQQKQNIAQDYNSPRYYPSNFPRCKESNNLINQITARWLTLGRYPSHRDFRKKNQTGSARVSSTSTNSHQSQTNRCSLSSDRPLQVHPQKDNTHYVNSLPSLDQRSHQFSKVSKEKPSLLRAFHSLENPSYMSSISSSSGGPNISILHIPEQNTNYPAASGGSLRTFRSNRDGRSLRELSPVRWCDRDVAGVYLGRAGWVQVQQRSLDETRRSLITHKTVVTTLSRASAETKTESNRRRPDSLNFSTSSSSSTPSTTHEVLGFDLNGRISPSPLTPIISPPPAFQDQEPQRSNSRPPYLPRSCAIDCDSPPRVRRTHNSRSRSKHLGTLSLENDDQLFPRNDCCKGIKNARTKEHRTVSSDSSSSPDRPGGSNVRRSRSLQLPEQRSPSSLMRPRRHLNRKHTLEENREKGGNLSMDMATEAKVVADFITKTRSRAAARDLLLTRYLQRPESGIDRNLSRSQTYNVCLMPGRSPKVSPCNPTTCDFWPNCQHPRKSQDIVDSFDADGYVTMRKKEPNRYLEPDRNSMHRGPSLSPVTPYRAFTSTEDSKAISRSGQEEGRFTSNRSSPSEGRITPQGSIKSLKSFEKHTSWDQQRTLSLPKSFREMYLGEPKARKNSPSRTAPVTPVRDISPSSMQKQKQNFPHCNSAPLFKSVDDDHLTQDERLASVTPTTALDEISENSGSESVVDKLRKSFSHKFYINSRSSDSPENLENSSLKNNFDENRSELSDRFSFGSISWRGSKDRQKQKFRKDKCKSADSGIQVERGNYAGDSSDSRDTDQQEDYESPVRRPGRHVRRVNSELGGRRLFSWEVRNRRRLKQHRKPSPDVVSVRSQPTTVQLSPQNLRRSTSQPLGLDVNGGLPLRKLRLSSDDERGVTSEDDAISGSESSLLSLERKIPTKNEEGVLAEALWDHVAIDARELAFRAGDVVEVHNKTDPDWWWGSTDGRCGWFPSSFVRLRVSQEDTVEDCLAAMAAGNRAAAHLRRTSISLLSNDQVRSCVVRELISTERDFVRVLRDVSEGYIVECRRRPDMFTPSQIHAIFANLEEILAFQTGFLQGLEVHIDHEAPYRSCVGDVFLRHQNGFRVYSDYCNSHPMAIATLQQLNQQQSYSAFFEGCRILRGLMEIPLDGYLLTPVQRICKYPLQLAELLKYTRADHPDHVPVKEALTVMRGVALLINERKRRMESLEKLAAWQSRVEGWEGEHLLETSSQLLHQDEAVRVTSGMWTTHISLFLFDHQLVYCKKDLLRRNQLIYKGRMCLDSSEVVDVPDGKDPVLGVTLRNAIKIHSLLSDKWLLFCARSGQDKTKWLAALAAERRLVQTDRQDGLEMTAAARQLARTSAQDRNKKYNRSKRDSSYERKVGTWFTWGGRKHHQQQIT